MIIVHGKLKLAPGGVEKVRPEMAAVLAATRAEDGCLQYSYGVDVDDPDTILILERWESLDHLQAHGKQPHLAVWTKSLLDVGIVGRELKATEAGETRDL